MASLATTDSERFTVEMRFCGSDSRSGRWWPKGYGHRHQDDQRPLTWSCGKSGRYLRLETSLAEAHKVEWGILCVATIFGGEAKTRNSLLRLGYFLREDVPDCKSIQTSTSLWNWQLIVSQTVHPHQIFNNFCDLLESLFDILFLGNKVWHNN